MDEEVKPQKWGSKERMALVAEVLRQKRMVQWLVRYIIENFGKCPPDKRPMEKCWEKMGCLACWKRFAEQAVAEEISPKERV